MQKKYLNFVSIFSAFHQFFHAQSLSFISFNLLSKFYFCFLGTLSNDVPVSMTGSQNRVVIIDTMTQNNLDHVTREDRSERSLLNAVDVSFVEAKKKKKDGKDKKEQDGKKKKDDKKKKSDDGKGEKSKDKSKSTKSSSQATPVMMPPPPPAAVVVQASTPLVKPSLSAPAPSPKEDEEGDGGFAQLGPRNGWIG